MSNDLVEIKILGKTYHIKCPASETASLERAAEFLDEKMRSSKNNKGVVNQDRVAIITALNLAHELFTTEHRKESHTHHINQRLCDLHAKIDDALATTLEMEQEAAE